MRLLRIMSLVPMVFLLVHGGNTSAAPFLLGLSPTSSTSITSGDTVTIDMFIADAGAGTSLSTEGLISAGGRLLSTPVVGSPSVTVTAISPNSTAFAGGATLYPPTAFPASAPGSFSNVAGLLEVVTFSFPLSPVVPSGSPAGIFIGTFELTITGATGDMITFRSDLLENDPTVGGAVVGNVSGLVTNFDGIIANDPMSQFSQVTITILQGAQVIPEPGSLLLWVGGVGGLAVIRRRRRRTG